ncbi:hypothetical protein C8R45DRAFT_1114220 [Mycena sanguinolenta]|nr:hypothetical protein C8R45DRAFT_1114220 [Mycena sanguinolenta]
METSRLTASMVSLPLSACLEIAIYSSVTDLISLLRLSRSVNVALRYLLYRTVAVGASAGKFLDSLAANGSFAAFGTVLVFEDRCAQVRPRLWAALLPTLVNLVGLTIAYDMPLPHRVIPEIAFRLTFFESLSYLGCMWAQLLTLQPGLEELILHDVIWGCIPDPQFLPRLRRLRGYPADIAKFTKFLTLEDVWFISKKPLSNGKPTLRSRSLPDFAVSPCRFSTLRISAPDFVRLSTAAPDVVSMLQHLVLDEDLTWSEFLLKSDVYGLGASTFGRAATALDRNFAHLRSVLVECLQSTQNRHYRPLLERIHSRCFAKILAGHCSAPVLEAFRFHAADGFAVWTGWGKESEQVQYWDENDTEITLLEPDAPAFFRYSWDLNGKGEETITTLVQRFTPRLFPPETRTRAREHPPKPSSKDETAEILLPALEWDFSEIVGPEIWAQAEDDVDDETKKAREEEDAARARTWDLVVGMVVDSMREPERRQWLHERRMEEESARMRAMRPPLVAEPDCADWSGPADQISGNLSNTDGEVPERLLREENTCPISEAIIKLLTTRAHEFMDGVDADEEMPALEDPEDVWVKSKL